MFRGFILGTWMNICSLHTSSFSMDHDVYSQFVSFEGSVVQQVESSVVLLGEVNVGHHHQDLDDVAKIFSNGVMERRVAVWILISGEEKVDIRNS